MSISEWMKIPYAPAILWTPIWAYLMSVSYEYSMRWLNLCWSTPVWAGSSGHYLPDSQGFGTWSSPSPFSTFCSVKYLNKSLVSVQAASTLNKSELSRLQVTEAQVKLSDLQTLLVQTPFLPCVSVVWLLSLLSQADFLHRAIRSTINPPGPIPPRPCQTHSHWSQVQHAWGNSLVGPVCPERWHSQKEGHRHSPDAYSSILPLVPHFPHQICRGALGIKAALPLELIFILLSHSLTVLLAFRLTLFTPLNFLRSLCF